MSKESDGASPKINWETVIVGVLFMIVAVYFGYGTIWGYYEQANVASSYNSVDVTILESKVSQRNLSDASGGGPIRSYQPHLLYEYEVDGQSYQSNRYGYMGDYVFDNAEDAQRIVDKYPQGSTKKGYYKPQEPKQSVLYKTSPAFPVFIWFPIGFFILGLVAAVAGYKGKFGGWKSNW